MVEISFVETDTGYCVFCGNAKAVGYLIKTTRGNWMFRTNDYTGGVYINSVELFAISVKLDGLNGGKDEI